MKQFFVIITLAGLMLQTFSKGLILAEFMMNKEYIARVLCVNRTKPKSGCDGHCYLMQKMKKETKEEQRGNAVKEKYEVIIAQAYHPFHIDLHTPTAILQTAYEGGKGRNPLHSVFRPPQAV
ncbi:hypothetical protein ACWKWU_19870 [Chitinophaga lutea]